MDEGSGEAARAGVRALVAAVAALVDATVERVLVSDQRVTSAAEAEHLLTAREDTEALADKMQRVVVLAVPVVRVLARGARFTRVPWVMVASSSFSIASTVRAGVRELQLRTSLVAYRIEQATGAPSDPGLVKKVAIELYLHPKRPPNVADRKLRLVRLTRRWLIRGAFGRGTSRRAAKALQSAERLDGRDLAARWAAANPRTSLGVRDVKSSHD
jgi:hypothetical protein